MKKFVSIILVILMFLLSACHEEVKNYKEAENDGATIQLSDVYNWGYVDKAGDFDLISTSTEYDATALFEVEKLKIKAETETPPQIAVVGGEVYVATTIDKEKGWLYKFENGKPKLLYEADYITSLFEHNGCLLFCAFEKEKTYKLMKYNPKAKTLVELAETYAYDVPIYNSCGDYISVTNLSANYNYNGGEIAREGDVYFYDFITGEERYSDKKVNLATERVVAVKDLKNNIYVTFNTSLAQLLFYDVDSGRLISQAHMNVLGARYKIFGNNLLIKDLDEFAIYNITDQTYKLISKMDVERAMNGEICGPTCELVGDTVFFSNYDVLLAYNMKENKVSALATNENISYSASDNEKTFAYSTANPITDGEESYYIIYKYTTK